MHVQVVEWCPPKLPDGTLDVRKYLAALDHAYNDGLPAPRTAFEWARIQEQWRARKH